MFGSISSIKPSTLGDPKGEKYISDKQHAELQKGHVKSGDLLITTRGNIGETGIIPEELDDVNINAQLVLLRCGNNINNRFLRIAFNCTYVKQQIEKNITGTALKSISATSVTCL